jgi:transposase
MFIRPCYRRKGCKRHAYWALVESYRTERGPRQRVVTYVGQLDRRGRLGVERAAEGWENDWRQRRFVEEEVGEWVEVDARRVRAENSRDFGAPWLGLQLARQLDLDGFLERTLSAGREQVPWPLMALALVLARLCEPASELHVAEHFYRHSALEDLLGISAEKVNDDRLYRALDALLPHKKALERHLQERLGRLFKLDYDLLLYDVTSTYFEGEAAANPLAQRGYSRDHRPDCKQVCIALVVTRGGMPLGYEVFAGNRVDVTTLQEVVTTMEGRYGAANRIWVMDRGMISAANMTFLSSGGRRYIAGTPRSLLKRFEQRLLEKDWRDIREGLEVKLCPSPDGAETFILCRSADRREKEKAMHARFEKRIEEALARLQADGARRRLAAGALERRVGRLLERNSRAAGLFRVSVNRSGVSWEKDERWRAWAELSQGCYLLRSNVTEWSAEDLWQAYIQLTDAEAAFRIHKSDLSIRPIWHQKEERVRAHILVCFLAYVLWKALGQMCRRAGLGDEPRRVFAELSEIKTVDVVLPTSTGATIRKRCVTRPTDHQAILLQRLGLHLPTHTRLITM